MKPEQRFVLDVASTEIPPKKTPLLFLLLPVDGADERTVEVRFVASSSKMFT